jgi:hypothetical protein
MSIQALFAKGKNINEADHAEGALMLQQLILVFSND